MKTIIVDESCWEFDNNCREEVEEVAKLCASYLIVGHRVRVSFGGMCFRLLVEGLVDMIECHHHVSTRLLEICHD